MKKQEKTKVVLKLCSQYGRHFDLKRNITGFFRIPLRQDHLTLRRHMTMEISAYEIIHYISAHLPSFSFSFFVLIVQKCYNSKEGFLYRVEVKLCG